MKTPCKFCVFAQYKGKTQTGCSIKMLDGFKENGTQVDEAYDEDKEFYLINKVCIGYRSSEWAKQHGTNIKQVVEEQIKNITLPCHIIVNPTKTIEEVEKIVKQISRQTLKPKLVTLLNRHINPLKLVKIIKNTELNWKVEDLKEENTLHFIDNLINRKPLAYHCIVDGDINWKENELDLIAKRVVFGEPFGMAKGSGFHLIPHIVYLAVEGNRKGNIEEKLNQKGWEIWNLSQ